MKTGDIDAARLAEIYTWTAAFYDGVVAEHQARAKEIAIEMLGRQPGERFLEAGVGTGWAFQRVAGASGGAWAAGLDVAIGMLEVARQRLASGRGRRKLPDLMLGDAGRLPFRDGVFDCLLCTYTLDVLPSEMVTPVLREMRRVLKPAGRLVVAGLTAGEGEDADFSADWQQRYAADPEYFGGARPLEAGPHLEAAGFGVLDRRYSGHGEGWPSEIILARPA